MLVEGEINQANLCKFARNGKLDKLKYICSFLDKNGKNAEFDLDIAGCDPCTFWDNTYNYAICWACYNGHILVVKYLMENWLQLIDISAENNWAISFACINGHIEVVKYLMKNWLHLIDISVNNNFAILWACSKGHIKVVKYLMKNWSHLVDITADDNYAICCACSYGHIEVVKYLMKNWSHLVDITARNNCAIRYAHINRRDEVVKYLIVKCIKKILNKGLNVIFLYKIISLLVDNDYIYEYKILTDELKNRKNQYDGYFYKIKQIEKLEEQIEKKNHLCSQIECHPKLIGGQMGKDCEEGFEYVKKLIK